MSKIFVVGDIHGNPSIVSSSNWIDGKGLTEEDVVIFLGDFGLYWSDKSSKEELYWLGWLASKPFTVCFVDGNHENFNVIENLPIEEKFNGLVNVDHRKSGDIFRLRRGEVYNINGKTIFTLGGALSIDKAFRTENISWWAGEQHTKEEENNALDNLDKVNWKVDYILTHTCPDDRIYGFIDNPYDEKFRDPVARFLQFIDNRLEYKEWHFGHFHNDRVLNKDDVYKCHYNLIEELV